LTAPLRHFDMLGFCAALDEERRARGLSWPALVEEINRPFAGTPSIPITVGTVRGIANKSSVNSGVVLQVLRWMKRTPESFLVPGAEPRADEVLSEPGVGRILRFDTRAMHAALDAERVRRGWTWKQLAEELPGFAPNMLTNLAKGPLIGFPRVMLLTQWLGRPAATFVRDHGR
jgi:hypothetical protein